MAFAMSVKRARTSSEKSMSVSRPAIVESTATLTALPVHSAHSELLTRAYTSKLSSPRQRSIRLISQRGALAASSAHAA